MGFVRGLVSKVKVDRNYWYKMPKLQVHLHTITRNE